MATPILQTAPYLNWLNYFPVTEGYVGSNPIGVANIFIPL